jgi:hypothetical protein
VAEDGRGLWVRAYVTREGSWRTECIHRVGKRNTRGASSESHTEAEARDAMAKLVTTAEKLGWRRRQRAGGFVRKADAFSLSNLPKPSKPTAKK